ncbi:DnaJ family domain-containing protein [uncultured Shimia sp.]|uniref:DnaJ family domain-containing protein n=1 Tax=uncultured Shimia sp. TaxID=573152 RepID=UPI002605A31E|nr:DnaJ family domain-containing protein [uncultured Shimia sp.]
MEIQSRRAETGNKDTYIQDRIIERHWNVSHPLNSAIEMAMNAADKSGEFKDLPGAGKPLEFLASPKDPVIDRLMKENQAKPLAIELKNKITELRQAVKAETDESVRKSLMKKIASQQLRLDLELEALRKFG